MRTSRSWEPELLLCCSGSFETSQTTINVANYVNGFYTVALVCNGQIVDAKTLIKQ